MTKFDVQTLKEDIAHVVGINKKTHREICDALNSSNSDRDYEYEDVMTLYMRKSTLEGEMSMAEWVLYLIKKQELEMSDGTLKEDS